MLVLPFILLAQSASLPPLAHDGGVCVGLSWVQLAPSEHAMVTSGPDFNVYRFNGPGGEDDQWRSVYSGRYANVNPDGPSLIERDGVVIRRAVHSGKFHGYLAEKDGRQNHFFGSIFIDTPSDLEFFARIDFGLVGQALCEKSSR